MTVRPTRPYGRGLKSYLVVRLPIVVHERVRVVAEKCGQSMSDWIRGLIEREVRGGEEEGR